jgi:hypothetical protein
MTELLGVVAIVAVVVWLVGARRRPGPAPEDDVTTPVDQRELEEAERDLEEDSKARPLHDGFEAEDADDWGPGAR